MFVKDLPKVEKYFYVYLGYWGKIKFINFYKVNVIHIPCNKLFTQYAIQETAQSLINNHLSHTKENYTRQMQIFSLKGCTKLIK